MHENLDVVFLGTGASWPTADRNTAAVAIRRGPEVLLFDCGEGTQRQFQRSAASYMGVSKIFLTHYHADHFLGLPGLVQTMGMNGRTEPLEIYGPRGIDRYVEPLLSIGYNKPAFPVRLVELKDKEAAHFAGYRVEARAVVHNVPAIGYALVEDTRPGRFNKPRALELGVPEGPAFGRLQRGESVTARDGRVVRSEDVLGPTRRGRTIAYSGDVKPCEAMVELARRADILIHEATYGNDFPEANEYGHSTAAQAAYIAAKAEAKRLYLTHFSARYTGVRQLVEEARKVFPAAEAAHDLLEVSVAFTDEPAAP
ncbi:MAG: ribonuclease Z [Methanobacteriota archaeon]